MKGRDHGAEQDRHPPLTAQKVHPDDPDPGQDQQDQGQFKDQPEQQEQAQAEIDKLGQVEHREQKLALIAQGKGDDQGPHHFEEKVIPQDKGDRAHRQKIIDDFLFLGVKGRRKKQPHLVENDGKSQAQPRDQGNLHLDEKRLQGGHVVEPVGINLGRLGFEPNPVGQVREFLRGPGLQDIGPFLGDRRLL